MPVNTRHNGDDDRSRGAGPAPGWSGLVTLNVPPMTAGERKLSRWLLFLEQIIKVPLFRCQSCGECILSSTAFICSQNCPKRMRNGPCGGTREDGSCEVYPDRRCVWHRITVRSERLGRTALLYRINPIHNWALEGTSSWLNVLRGRAKGPVFFPPRGRSRTKDLLSDGLAGKD